MLGPSLVVLALGVLILVTMRVLRRGPAVTPRSAPGHGLQSTAEKSETDDVTTPRRVDPQSATADGNDGRREPTRASVPHPRTVTRRVFSGR